MSKLRKSSSAPSQLRKVNKINDLRGDALTALVSCIPTVICDARAGLDDFRNWRFQLRRVARRQLAGPTASVLVAIADRSQPAIIINDVRFTFRDDVGVVGRDA